MGAHYYAENTGILNAKMDERTRRSDDELAPNLRRTTPEPDVISLPSSKLRVGLGLAIAIGLVVAAYEIVHLYRASLEAQVVNEQRTLSETGTPWIVVYLGINMAIEFHQVEPPVIVVVKKGRTPADERNA